MKKNYLLATALAITTLAGCTDDGFVGDQSVKEANGSGAISFNMSTPAITRAADKTGSAAAIDLNNNFVLFGYKTMSDASKQKVFDNYQANYVTNSAMTSTTNSAGWEYVGYTYLHADMTGNTGVTGNATGDYAQTIKYWDYSASNYKFFAYSLGAGKTGPTWANASLMTNDPEDKYTLSGDKDQLSTCYISELKKIDDPSGSTPTEVDLRFLSFLSKIRVGFFENIPGYSVKDLKFYVDGSTKSTGDAANDGLAATLYEATGTGTMPNGGTYTITFDANGKPIVTFSSSGATYSVSQGLGKLNGYAAAEYKEASGYVYLGRTSNAATYAYVSYTDAMTNEPYTKVLPNAVGTELTLKCDYTLVSRDGTGETIEVVGATTKVPALYTQWKPNFAYTYLFKISDNTNGEVGEVVGLYPITLDAIVASQQDGSQETITTVSEPSITTFGTVTAEGKTTYVSGGNEYAAGSDIYATFVDAGVVITPTLGTNVNVYLATTTNATTYPITEASVADALLEVSIETKKINLVKINSITDTYFTAAPTTSVAGVPSEDGKWLSTIVTLTANPGESWPAAYFSDQGCTVTAPTTYANGTYYQKWTKALKLTGVVATTSTTALVVEYVKTAATYNTETVTIADQAALSAYTGKLYTDEDGKIEASATYDSGVTYRKRLSVKTKGAYAYKVIRVN